MSSSTVPASFTIAALVWPIISSVLQLVFIAVAWWWRKSVVSHDGLDKALGPVVQRIGELEDGHEALAVAQKNLPTRDDLMRMTGEIQAARGDIRTAVAEMEGNRRELAAQIEGVSKLLDGSQRMVSMLTEHLLNQSR